MTDTSTHAHESALPEGRVTFLFTDIQGSTQLLRRLGDDYGRVLGTHRALLRATFDEHNGHEVDTQGDAFFVAFGRANDAVAAAITSQRALADHDWPHGDPVLVRMGIHTGEPVVIDDHYVGLDVHRAARICSSAHGGQIVLSEPAHHELELALLEDVSFRDLGLHRLKDLEHPEQIFQVEIQGLPATFPPLRSARPPTNIPRHLSTMIGRRAEMDELRALLLREGIRIVTVTGPGGTGKTRLSVAVALEVLDDFIDGAFFVDLSMIESADHLASVIAQTLDIPLDGDRSGLDAIIDHIGSKHMLLLLDNFEQVLEGAVVVSGVLQACPRVTALVTSRATLSIGGEREYSLPPLGLPTEATRRSVASSEAAQLFIERAAEAKPGFELTDQNAAAIAEICKLLDGLPLALELAAARVKLFSPASLVERLDSRLTLLTGGASDSPVRHQALRATIDWSFDLLTEEEKAFFRDFAVFSGGAKFDAIENVIGRNDILERLTSLVNHSLVRRTEAPDDEVRFRMLQTIRDYALELLAADPIRAEVRDRHAHYFLAMAERTSHQSSQQSAALAEVDEEYDNMRAALTWLLEGEGSSRNSGILALRLATGLGRYWYTHGRPVEGSSWLERTLANAVDAPEATRAHALRLLGVLMDQRRQLDRAWELFEQALDYFRRSGDRAGEGACLNSLGVVARERGDLATAESLLTTSVALRREIGDESGISSSLSNLGILSLDRSELDRAEELFTESLELDRKRGDEWGAACTANNLGVVHIERGDLNRGRSMIEGAIRSFVELNDLDGTAESLEAIAGTAGAGGQFVRAARLAGSADSLRRSLGIPLGSIDKARLERWLSNARAELGDAAFSSAWADGAEMTADQAVDYALGASSKTDGIDDDEEDGTGIR